MTAFPRTNVGGLSVSRMVIGSNWFLGYSHTTKAKDRYIKETFSDYKKIADVLEVFFRAGVDTLIFEITQQTMLNAVKEAEDRTGVKGIIISTPTFETNAETPEKGIDKAHAEAILDRQAELGASICLPHMCTTDNLVDRCTRKIRHMDELCKMIRERGMIPGLSTHMPESIVFADESGLDVETYISIYNAMGFLMQVEVDWVAEIIRNAKKPVLTIKPLASGQLRPYQGLHFVWNTIRDIDMVAIGTMSPYEAAEDIEISLSILERRRAEIELQETRSKASVKTKKN